jgi:hypothetical protein
MGRESKSAPEFRFMAITTNFWRFLNHILTVMSNDVIFDIHCKDHHTHRITPRFVDVLREIQLERNCHWWARFVDVNWPVMFDERASVWGQPREQDRRLDNEENDIDKTQAQPDVRSLKREAVPQSLSKPGGAFVLFRRDSEYWRWKHPLYRNLKNTHLK